MSKNSAAPATGFEALSRVNLREMLVLQDTASQVLADLTRMEGVDKAAGVEAEVTSRELIQSIYDFGPDREEDRKPFVYQDGVAVIPIHGTLINRFNYSWGFVTGFQYIRRMLNAALDDDDVDLIVYDVDSPGGEAAGCFELAREILASRRVKPSLAVIDSKAASGGVALALCASTVYAIPSASVGSIGVYRMHVSYEGAHKQAGIKVTFAVAGDHKIDGNPYSDLPESVLNEWTKSAGKTWDEFISLIAEARDLEEDAVRDTQARIYDADDALAKGLIDAVKTPTEAIAAFLASLADLEPSNSDEEDRVMATTSGKQEVTSGMTAADKDWIKEMIGSAVGALGSNINRSQQIKDHAASKGQVALGARLIANANISAEDAIEMINDAASAAAPKKAVKAPKGKAKVSARVEDEEDDEDLDGDDDLEGDDEEDDDNDEEGDDEEDAAQAAELARERRIKAKKGGNKAKSGGKRDKVNHLDAAMKRTGGAADIGGGKPNGGGKPQSRLLADHAAVSGADWSKKAISSN